MRDTGQSITRSFDLAVLCAANVTPGQGKALFVAVGAQSKVCLYLYQKLQGCPITFIFL